MDTISCLLRYPWRSLTALAAVYDVLAYHHLPKERVARELGAAIHARLPRTLAALDSDARAALRALAQADDLTLRHADFITRFGPLHPYRPWNPDAPPAPWPTPLSPAATLVHYGLAYPLSLGTRRRPLRVVLLPHDLHAALAAHLDLPATFPSPTTPILPYPRTGYDLDADVFTFLSFLNRQDYAVRHDRWLPPRALQALNEYLHPPDDLGPGRSELQAARIPFVHCLAERAGLAGLVGGCLKPTLIAQEWLAAPRPRRLRVLWDAWREPSDANHALWCRYRLPALQEDDDPVARFHALVEPLAACPVGPLGQPADLLDRLVERNPALLRPQATYAAWAALDPGERAGFRSRAHVVLLALLTGPLTWFGCLASSSPDLGGGEEIRLTSLGAALLGRDDGVWPADPAPAPLVIAPLLSPSASLGVNADGTSAVEGPALSADGASVVEGPVLSPVEGAVVLVEAPAGLPLPDRFVLEAVVPPALSPSALLGANSVEGPACYRLTRPRFLRALQQGHTVEGVVNFFERASGEPLPALVLDALYRWEEEFDRVAIRQVLLLQTRDAGVLRDLTGQRHIREMLGRTLNARTVVVRADQLDALLRRLARRGILPRLDLSHPHPGPLPGRERGAPSPPAPLPGRERGVPSPPAPLPGTERGEERAAIAVALRVHAHLADALGLPTRPAFALARRWSEGLPLPLRDAVERAVEQTLNALHRAAPMEMEDHLPGPVGPLLESLEVAIRERATVEIEYYTAGRAHRTTRRVDPLRLEWHGDVVYLIAYCHLRGDERVFRVDRIEWVENGE
jgi:hypothetical protein